MKATYCFITAALLATAVAAQSGEPLKPTPQNPAAEPVINCDFEKVKVEEALDWLQKTHGLKIVRDDSIGQAARQEITVKLKDVTPDKALEAILKPANLAFTVKNGAVRVFAYPLTAPSANKPSVAMSNLYIRHLATVSCDFQETPLSDTLNHLREKYNVNIVSDSSARDMADKEVTVKLKNTTMEKALQRILRPLGLRAAVEDNIVFIATPERLNRYQTMIRKQYYASDLFFADSYGRNDDDDDNNGNDNGIDKAQAVRNVMTIIVLFTGRKNWDHVASLSSTTENDNDNGSTP